MASLESIIKYGVNNRINGEKYAPGHIVRKAAEMQELIRQDATELVHRQQTILADTGLTAEGHAREIKKLAAGFVAKLKDIETTVVGRLSTQRASLAAALYRPAAKEPSLVDVLREREVRDVLRTLSEGERLLAFQRAIEEGDEQMFSAFANSPRIAPLVSDRVLSEGKRLWFQRSHPEAAAELADFEAAETALRENLNDVLSAVATEAEIQDDSMRARLQRLGQ